MPSFSQENDFYLADFDESIDSIMLDVIDQMNYQSGRANPKGLNFYINSDGGDAEKAFALVSVIERARLADVPTRSVVLSQALSSGSLVAVACETRHAARTANYLIHYGEVDAPGRDPVSVKRIAEANLAHFDRILNHYNKYCKFPDLENLLTQDNLYLTASQALAYGMHDGYWT